MTVAAVGCLSVIVVLVTVAIVIVTGISWPYAVAVAVLAFLTSAGLLGLAAAGVDIIIRERRSR